MRLVIIRKTLEVTGKARWGPEVLMPFVRSEKKSLVYNHSKIQQLFFFLMALKLLYVLRMATRPILGILILLTITFRCCEGQTTGTGN